jgi:lipopolysaccharide biosynthesis protein
MARFSINTNSDVPTIVSNSFKPTLIPASQDIKNLNLAVAAHIFYPDLTDLIITKLKNIPTSKLKLKVLITTDTKEKQRQIEESFRKANFDYKIKIFENIGRDIAPSFIGFKDEILSSDLFLHLHTKKSLYNPDLNLWRDDILNKLLGNKEIAEQNIRLVSSDIGLLAPKPPEFIRLHMNWGEESDYSHARTLLKRAGCKITKLNPLYFPAGSMFFARTEAIEPIINNLKLSDFDEESGQISGTMAHAVERSFCFSAEITKLNWLVVDVKNDKPIYFKPKYKLLSKHPLVWLKYKLFRRKK